MEKNIVNKNLKCLKILIKKYQKLKESELKNDLTTN